MTKNNFIKAVIEVSVILIGWFLAQLILFPITSVIDYTHVTQLEIVCVVTILVLYWIFFFKRSIIIKSIWVKSILFIVAIIVLLFFVSQFLKFLDIIDSFDLNLFGQKRIETTVAQESVVLNYIYRSHLLLYTSVIISLVFFEFKLLKSILNFIARMR